MTTVICIEMLYPDLEAPDKIHRLADQGFNAVEFWSWRDKDMPALGSACRARDVSVVNFSGHRRGSLILEEEHPFVLEDLREAVRVAADLECSRLMLLSDQLGQGGVVERKSSLDADAKHRNLVAGLKRALAETPEEIDLVLEPLNTRVDHAGYYLDSMEEAVRVISEVDDPRLTILCDLYHMGVMGEDLETLIHTHSGQIGHYHAADFPGRHEPGTGTADWVSLLAAIEQIDQKATVGWEYSPSGDVDRSLAAIRFSLEDVQRLQR